MKKILLIIVISLVSNKVFNQVDTIFSNNQKIPCNVKEITPDAVKFSYLGEDLINTIYKNSIQKIAFKSGRIQEFTEASSLKKVVLCRF